MIYWVDSLLVLWIHTHTQRNIMNNLVRCVRKNVTCTVISYMSSYMDYFIEYYLYTTTHRM